MKKLPSVQEIQAERARRNLADFVRQAWPIVEPGTPLLWGWHIDAICEHLQAVTRGQIRKLLINVPPGHMKSLITSVFWPAWEWIDAPEIRSLFSSYALDLALRDSMRCRDILTSEWYQQTFDVHWTVKDGHWRLREEQNAKSYFENSKKGFRFCLSVGSRATGFRGNKVVADDPLNAKDAYSKAKRDEAAFWWTKVMPTRINDPRVGAFVMIMQRLHEEDPSGLVLSLGGYEHLCLPSEFDPSRRIVTSIGWTDPRKEEGELLFPELFTKDVIAEAKKILRGDYAGQHQQEPAPATGAILKKHWWRYWQFYGQNLPPVRVKTEDGTIVEHVAVELPPAFDRELQSWDMAFKDTKDSSKVAGQVWGQVKANKYLIDYVCEHKSFTESVHAVKKMTVAHPKAHLKLVEDKANGPAIIDTLHNQIAGIVAVQPDGSKEARAFAVTPDIEAGNVYLPHPDLYPWVQTFLDNATAFPTGKINDDVDAATQALKRMQRLIERELEFT